MLDGACKELNLANSSSNITCAVHTVLCTPTSLRVLLSLPLPLILPFLLLLLRVASTLNRRWEDMGVLQASTAQYPPFCTTQPLANCVKCCVLPVI